MLTTEMTLEFNNPQVIDEKEFSDILELNFGEVNKKNPKTESKEESKAESSEEEGEGEVEPKIATKVPFNESGSSNKEVKPTEEVYINTINTLADIGFTEVWDGYDENAEVTEESVKKFIDANINKRVEESFEDFFSSLTDFSKRIINYDLTAKGENVDTFLRSLIEENNIKSLDVSNEYDQEKILRQWYKNEDKFSVEEINEKINELKDAGLLEKEAKRIKPKLDLEAENIARKQEEEQKLLRDIEKKVSQNYENRVIDVLKSGTVGGIKLNKEELQEIYSFLTNDTMEVTVHGGKKATMTPLEAIIFFNKYDKKGSIENLALATLLLTNPQKFEEAYSKKAMTKVTTEVVNDIKKSNKLKIGGGGSSMPQEKTPSKDDKKSYYKWPLIM